MAQRTHDLLGQAGRGSMARSGAAAHRQRPLDATLPTLGSRPTSRGGPPRQHLRPIRRAWLAGHSDLADGTKRSYCTSVERHLKPAFGTLPLTDVSPALVRSWYNSYGQRTPTARAHAYQVLSGIFRQAEDDEIIVRSPCRIRGASVSRSSREPQVLTLAELLALTAAMPAQHRAMTLICGLCGLRFGEATGLRRQDLDLDEGLLHVRRGVVRVAGVKQLSRPKTPAAVRTVAMPALAVLELKVGSQHSAGNRRGLAVAGTRPG